MRPFVDPYAMFTRLYAYSHSENALSQSLLQSLPTTLQGTNNEYPLLTVDSFQHPRLSALASVKFLPQISLCVLSIVFHAILIL
jgi:hypothetical protein